MPPLRRHFPRPSRRPSGFLRAILGAAAFGLALGESRAAITVDLSIGTQTGANIQLSSTNTSYFNFGVTQLGEDQGLTIDSVRLYFQGQGNKNSPEDVVIQLYSGFGATGTVISTATIVKTTMTNQYDPYDVLFGVKYLLTAGAYSVKVSTLSTTTYNFKSGLLNVVDSTGGVLITSSNWVQDNNTTGTASTSLSSTSNVLADYSLATKTVAFGNYRVGSTLSQAVAVTNAGFVTSNNVTESLTITGTTNVANGTISVPGTPAWLNPGQSMNLTVGLDGTIAGPNSGSATPSFGSVKGDSLSTTTTTTSIGSEIISISGTGYRQAVPGYSTTSPNIGNFRVGATNVTGTITLSNTATSSDAYSEKLSVSSVSNSGKATVGTMPALIAAGGSSSLTVGITTIAAGANTGTARLGLSSDGTGTSGLSALVLSPQDISITAYGYRAAIAGYSSTSLSLGNYRVGTTNVTGDVTISNTVSSADAYSEKLLVASATPGTGATAGTLPSLIAPQGNATLTLGISTIAAGLNSRSVTVGVSTDGTGTSGLSASGIGTQVISLGATGYRAATASFNATTIDLGNFRVGSVNVTGSGTLTASNSLTADGYSEKASIESSSTTGGASMVTVPGLIAAGESAELAFSLAEIASVGLNAGTVILGLKSSGSGTSGLADLSRGTQEITVRAYGFLAATPSLATTSVNLGNYRVGASFSTSNVEVSNSTAAGVSSEKLEVSSATLSGSASVGTLPGLIDPGSSTSVLVGLSGTAVAGPNSGTVTLNLKSNGTGTSGLSSASVGSQGIEVTAHGYRLATQSFSATDVDLGKFHVGASNVSGSTTISNASTNDAYSEKLEILSSATSGGASHGTLPGLIAAGGHASLSLTLASVSSVGANTGSVTVGLKSNGTGTSGLSAYDLGTQVVGVSATGYSGQSTWNAGASGSWRSFGNWDTSGGLPGVDGALSVDDKATFGAGPSGATTISLDGESPVLTALTFSNSGAAYTVRSGTGGSITLGTGSKTATLTNSAGSHAVSAGVSLANDTVASVASGTVLVLSGALNGSGKLTKEGAGILSITGTGNLSGTSTVSAGLLKVNGSIADSAVTVNDGGTLGGGGTVGAILVAAGGTLSPGNSPGTLNAGATTWAGGGNYNWQIYNANGPAGVGGWDKLAITGDLDLTGLTALSRFNINLWSLSGINPDANGAAINFSSSSTFTWTIASVSGSILGFDAAFFNVNLAATNGTAGFTNDLSWVATNGKTYYGSIDLVQNGQNLDLVYSPGVPEPSTYGMMIGGLALAAAAIRRRKRQAGSKPARAEWPT